MKRSTLFLSAFVYFILLCPCVAWANPIAGFMPSVFLLIFWILFALMLIMSKIGGYYKVIKNRRMDMIVGIFFIPAYFWFSTTYFNLFLFFIIPLYFLFLAFCPTFRGIRMCILSMGKPDIRLKKYGVDPKKMRMSGILLIVLSSYLIVFGVEFEGVIQGGHRADRSGIWHDELVKQTLKYIRIESEFAKKGQYTYNFNNFGLGLAEINDQNKANAQYYQ